MLIVWRIFNILLWKNLQLSIFPAQTLFSITLVCPVFVASNHESFIIETRITATAGRKDE